MHRVRSVGVSRLNRFLVLRAASPVWVSGPIPIQENMDVAIVPVWSAFPRVVLGSRQCSFHHMASLISLSFVGRCSPWAFWPLGKTLSILLSRRSRIFSAPMNAHYGQSDTRGINPVRLVQSLREMVACGASTAATFQGQAHVLQPMEQFPPDD